MINDQTGIRVAIVGPIWQQNVLSLWLQAIGQVTSVTCTTDVSSLAFCPEQDLVILVTMDKPVSTSTAESSIESLDTQIQSIQQRWPIARLLVLADKPDEQPEMCPTDQNVFWLTETSPQQVIGLLGQMLKPNASPTTNSQISTNRDKKFNES